MLSSLKSVARAALRAIPLALYRAAIRRDVLVFLYHVVGPPDLAHVRHLYRYKSPEAFESDLIYLARRFHMASYDEIASPGNRRGRPAAHITFDDGYSECETLARPILLKHGIPGTFFVTTGLIDNRTMFHRNKASLCVEAVRRLPAGETASFLREHAPRLGRSFPDREAFRRWILALPPHQEALLDEACVSLGIDVPEYLRRRQPYMTTGQIRRLAAEGFTIGAHARRHVPLGSLGQAAAEEEIVDSCRVVQGLTGRTRVPFAFPHSADGVDRAFLRELVAARPVVGRLFDTHRLRRDDAIVNRITADAPPASSGSTNLPQMLHAAYQEEAVEAFGRLVAGRVRRTAPGGTAERPGRR